MTWPLTPNLHIVPRIERRSNKSCKLGDLDIPKDTVVVIPIYTLCRDSVLSSCPSLTIKSTYLTFSYRDTSRMPTNLDLNDG